MAESLGRIRVRTPDETLAWTAEGDLVPGIPYTYVSDGVAVMVDWLQLPQTGGQVEKWDLTDDEWADLRRTIDPDESRGLWIGLVLVAGVAVLALVVGWWARGVWG